MPLFSSSSPFDSDVEKATGEMNTTEDWGVIMDLCEKVTRTPNGSKDCLKSILKRMNHKVPHVAMQALTLLDACVSNCGKSFHLEVASREFVSECRAMIDGKVNVHPKVALKLKQLIQKWAEGDFKSESSLNLIPTLYNGLKSEGHDFSSHDPVPKSTQLSSDPNVVSSQKEEDDIAKAIALSLKEPEKSTPNTSQAQSLYPNFSAASTGRSSSPVQKEMRKVRALYDFEAAEDNELTFKAGEIIHIIDDSDSNWWKGSNQRGQGLFPANFATADLSAEPEAEITREKKVKFNEEVEVKTVEPVPEVLEVDEERIDQVLGLIQNADPTGETRPDTSEMLSLEEQCKAMGPLIDTELEMIDRKHASLMELNGRVMDALQMYHDLMKGIPQYPAYPVKTHEQYAVSHVQQHMYNGQPGYLPGQVAGATVPPCGQIPQQNQLPSHVEMPPQSHVSMTQTQSLPFSTPVQNFTSTQASFNGLPETLNGAHTATVTSYGPQSTSYNPPPLNPNVPVLNSGQNMGIPSTYMGQQMNSQQPIYNQQPLL